MSTLEQFLKDLFQASWVKGYFTDCRSFEAGWPKASRTYQNVEEVKSYLKEAEDVCCYFGVAPRRNRTGHKESIVEVSTLWVDVDNNIGINEILEASYGTDSRYGRPTYIVSSGHGYHLYWVLTSPTTDLELVETANRELARIYGGDNKCYNINRLLRLPGSINHKDPSLLKPVSIIGYTGIKRPWNYYRDIVDISYAPSSSNSCESFFDIENVSPVDLETLDVHPKWVDGIKKGVRSIYHDYTKPNGEADRSSLDFALTIRLVGAALSNSEIVYIFTNPSFGISEKTLELRGSARQRYLCRNILRAREKVQSDKGYR